MEIFTGFVIGLLGSLHCIGMCGPIALALPTGPGKSIRFYSGRLLYNFGRVITYSVFGLIFGFIGKNLAIVGLQRWVSIISGVLIIIIVLLPSAAKTGLIMKLPFGKATQKIKDAFGNLFRKGSLSSMLFIGIVNGLLPCGFVYVGIAGAMAVGDVGMGVVYMALFGLGTIPVMFVTSVSGKFYQYWNQTEVNEDNSGARNIAGSVIYTEGNESGIMYISPKTEKMMKVIPAEHMNHDSLKTKDCCK